MQHAKSTSRSPFTKQVQVLFYCTSNFEIVEPLKMSYQVTHLKSSERVILRFTTASLSNGTVHLNIHVTISAIYDLCHIFLFSFSLFPFSLFLSLCLYFPPLTLSLSLALSFRIPFTRIFFSGSRFYQLTGNMSVEEKCECV